MREKLQNLSPRRQKFVLEYAKDFNGAKSAIRSGYSKKTARSQASRLLSDVNVKAAIQELKAEIIEQARVTVDRVIEELAAIAFANITDFIDYSNGVYKIHDINQLNRQQKAGLRLFKVHYGEKSTSISIATQDKLRALDILGNYLGMFDHNRQTANPRKEEEKKDLEEFKEKVKHMTIEEKYAWLDNACGKEKQ